MGFSGNAPPCDKTTCFAYADGRCRVLTDTRFNSDCPFFKDKKAKEAEDALCNQRVEIWKNNRKFFLFGGEIR